MAENPEARPEKVAALPVSDLPHAPCAWLLRLALTATTPSLLDPNWDSILQEDGHAARGTL